MGTQKPILPFFLLFAAALSLIGIFFAQNYMRETSPLSLVAQSTYYGPKGTNSNPQLVRIEVLVYDSPLEQGVEVESAQFDKTEIPLKPRDIYGYRGAASFQKDPGKYKLRWTVNRSRVAWPRSISHEETVEINPRDLWVQISIEGETVKIH